MWNLLLPALLTLGGTVIASNANERAAQTASQATLQGAQIQADALRQAEGTLNDVRTQAQPAQNYLRGVMASPNDLTPAQQAALEINRRTVANEIHSSPFAGSGRTAAALFKKSDSDFVTSALDTNRGRAISAADTLYAPATAATTGIANLQGAEGRVSGDAMTKTGLYDAQAGIANGALTGRALGDIGSLIANQQRESRYADRLSSIEKSLGSNKTTSG